MVSDQKLTDDVSIFQDQNPSDYYGLKYVTRPLDDAINDRSCADIFDGCFDPENYTLECFDEAEINYDESDGFQKKLATLKKA